MTTLAEMRNSFLRRSAGLADDLANGDSDIDAYLNNAYQFIVPDRVPGQLTEGTWDLTTIALTHTYDFPDWVHTVKRQPRIGNFELAMYGREAEFWHRHDPEDTNSSRPVSVLVKGETVRFHQQPDAEYVVTFNTRNYPNDGSALASLAATGIVNQNHAEAVVWAGIGEFAEDYDLVDLMTKAEVKFERHISRLRARSLFRALDRRRRRTY